MLAYEEFPQHVTKKWLIIKLGYYTKKDGRLVMNYHAMKKYIYTPELVEDVLGLTYDQFKRIRIFNTVQSKKIINHIFN